MALHTELPIYRTGVDLLAIGYVIQRDMPRGFKRSLGEKIVQSCTDMLEQMALANAKRRGERAAHIEQLLALVRAAEVTLRVAHELRAVSTARWSEAVLVLQRIGAQAAYHPLASQGRAGRGAAMRLMSFALTEASILDQTKDVTRRLGWLNLKRGDQLRPVRKCMGLRKGENPVVLCDPITVLDVRREPLRRMTDDLDYGFRECTREGFGWHPEYNDPGRFVAMFCATHRGCTPETVVTRIVFSYEGLC